MSDVIAIAIERFSFLPAIPGAAIVVGAVLFAVSALLHRRAWGVNRHGTRPPDEFHPGSSRPIGRADRVERLVAALVLVAWVFADISATILVEPPAVAWWQFATPILIAVAGPVIVLVVDLRTPVRAEAPVAPVVPRNSRSFVERRELGLLVALLMAVVATCLIAGAASGPAADGWYSVLEFDAGGPSPAAVTFFGWAFGVPTLIATGALAGVCLVSLMIVARRPFVRPESVADEVIVRRGFARAIVRPSIGALLLSLGGAWLLIGVAGMGVAGVGLPGIGNFFWSPGYSAIAPSMVWAGWLVEVAGAAILFGSLFVARLRSSQQPVVYSPLGTGTSS